MRHAQRFNEFMRVAGAQELVNAGSKDSDEGEEHPVFFRRQARKALETRACDIRATKMGVVDSEGFCILQQLILDKNQGKPL